MREYACNGIMECKRVDIWFDSCTGSRWISRYVAYGGIRISDV